VASAVGIADIPQIETTPMRKDFAYAHPRRAEGCICRGDVIATLVLIPVGPKNSIGERSSDVARHGRRELFCMSSRPFARRLAARR
jgi:hypothetical protein